MAVNDKCPRQPIAEYPILEVKSAIINSIFGKKIEKRHESDWDEFFRFYHDETKTMHSGSLPARVVKYTRKSVGTHRDFHRLLSAIVEKDMATNGTELREILKEQVAAIVSDNEKVQASVGGGSSGNGGQNGATGPGGGRSHNVDAVNYILDCVLRILLMANINKQLETDTEVVSWPHEGDLNGLMGQIRQRASQEEDLLSSAGQVQAYTLRYVTNRGGRIHPYFTAAFMARICDLDVQWTDSLEDHLRLSQGKRPVLRIFGHKRWLIEQLEAQESGPNKHGVRPPSDLLRETISTLDLLFPFEDADTRSFCDSKGWRFHRLGSMKRVLNLNDYDYWRERLLEVHEDVFQAPPATWKQLYFDRRNPQQFWTFWIALIILALTILSTISTILQTGYSIAAYYKS